MSLDWSSRALQEEGKKFKERSKGGDQGGLLLPAGDVNANLWKILVLPRDKILRAHKDASRPISTTGN